MKRWPPPSRILLAASAALVFAALAVMVAAVPERGGQSPIGHDLVRMSFWLSIGAFLLVVGAIAVAAYRAGDN